MKLINVITAAITKGLTVISGDSREVCTKHKFVLSCAVGDEFDGFDKLLVCDYCGQEMLQRPGGRFKLVPASSTEGDGE